MQRSRVLQTGILALGALWAMGAAGQSHVEVCADEDDLEDLDHDETRVVARLRGLCEVPSVSTSGVGTFDATIDDAAGLITWSLTYDRLATPVEQAHIHLGERHTNGGISAFLCSNAEDAPADTQACPATSATLNGTVTAAHVVGPEEQGIAAGEFEKLVHAIRAGAAYVNVHTTAFPAGEIRGQIVDHDDDDDDDDDD